MEILTASQEFYASGGNILLKRVYFFLDKGGAAC